jgi:UDP-3-O-[3-hydroxymyristoyl] N-acetylglucosamine deacetylase
VIHQRTLKTQVKATGVGLHTGVKVSMTLRPAHENTGIVFRRTDLPTAPTVRALASLVTDTRLSTCIEENGGKVATIEHLMSALSGLGIDNAYVDIDGPEVPLLDGSAAPFVYLVREAGVLSQRAAKRYVKVLKSVELVDGDKRVSLAPHAGFTLDFSIDFDHPVFEKSGKAVKLDFAHTSFVAEVARARTFGFVSEVEAMRKAGLGRGASLDNVIVIDDFRVLNAEGLRFDDEFVKHKALDAVGDLYLAGGQIVGAFAGHKSGHAMNNQLLRKLLADQSAWEWASFANESALPRAFASMLEGWVPGQVQGV